MQWADVDGDGDLDLALTGSRTDGMHLVMRNMLPAADAAAASTSASSMRRAARLAPAPRCASFAAGTTRLIGARLVDSGSGYDAQNDMPVHVGVPAGVSRVDVQVIVPAGGKRTPIWQRGVAPGEDDYGSNELIGSTRNIVITPSTTRCHATAPSGVTS